MAPGCLEWRRLVIVPSCQSSGVFLVAVKAAVSPVSTYENAHGHLKITITVYALQSTRTVCASLPLTNGLLELILTVRPTGVGLW